MNGVELRTSYQILRVFEKPDEAQGNQAVIFFERDHIDLPYEPTKISADMYKLKGIETTCFVSLVTTGHYNVQCFNKNNAIQYCGHGMIAAARTVFASSGLSSIIINDHSTASHHTDKAGHDAVELKMPRLLAQLEAVPNWVSNTLIFGGKTLLPHYSAVSDKKDGYLLLEFVPLLSIDIFSAMQLDLNKVCENSNRAIVVVQFDQANEHLYMRYFAPQYGVPEDSATGSVIRFVADYIEQRYQCTHFDVSQCSLQGGFMEVDCGADGIKITAKVSMESN